MTPSDAEAPINLATNTTNTNEGRMSDEEFKKALEASREIELTVTAEHPAGRSPIPSGSCAKATTCISCR